MIKPDGVRRGLVSDVIAKFEVKGYKLQALKLCKPHVSIIDKLYADHIGKEYYRRLTKYINSGPVCVMVWTGDDVVLQIRKIIGATNPLTSTMTSVRGKYGIEIGRNIVHASDSAESAKQEMSLFFSEKEIIN